MPSRSSPQIPKLNFIEDYYQESRNVNFQTISLTQRDSTDDLGAFRSTDHLLPCSALQSQRTYNADLIQPSPLLSDRRGLNFESTTDLKAFVTIDLAKINRERQNQLKLALEDNLREKQTHVNEIISSFNQQRTEYDQASRALERRSKELESEISRQRDHISTLKRRAAQTDSEIQNNERQYVQKVSEITNQISQQEEILGNLEKELKIQESEAQILHYEQQSIEQRIEVRHQVRMQELDVKVKPLTDEHEQLSLNIQLLQNNLEILKGVREQNENEETMIEEDLSVANQTKIGLIYQREEIEQYVEKIKAENLDLQFISSIISNQDYMTQWDALMARLVQEKQKCLLVDLIRELHQYILGLSSNTTDNSVMQSEELEELQFMIEKRAITIPEAVELVADFAQNKVKLDLNPKILEEKLTQVNSMIDSDFLIDSISELTSLDFQMKDIDSRVKIITNRCQNELLPRQKAVINFLLILQLSLSKSQMQAEINLHESSLFEFQGTLEILEEEINDIQANFERTQLVQQPDELSENKNLKNKAQKIKMNIDTGEKEIQQMRQEWEKINQRKESLLKELKKVQEEYEQKKTLLQQIYAEVIDNVKRERSNTLQYEYTNPQIQEMTREVAQLKCDKESAQKRMKYMEQKLLNAQDSVSHAKSVLENHLLQIKQDQLHSKIAQGSAGLKQKRKLSIQDEGETPLIIQKKLSEQPMRQKEQNPLQLISRKESPVHLNRFQDRVHLKSEILSQKMDQSKSVSSQTHEKLNSRADRKTLHQQLIEPDDSSRSTLEANEMNQSSRILISKNTHNSGNQSKGLSQEHRDVIKAYLQKDKSVSAADIVKYNYESSAALSSLEDLNSQQSSKQQTVSAINLVSIAQSKNIPIQTLITPRENILEMMQYNHSHQVSVVSQPPQYEIGLYGQFRHNSSIGSTDSLCQPTENQLSHDNLMKHAASFNLQDSPSLQPRQQKIMQSQSLFQVLPSIKISLRSSQNNSIDAGRSSLGSSLGSSINFKENVAPNMHTTGSSTLNFRKLSQAPSLSTLQPQQIQNKPPAVPSGKLLSSQNSQCYLIDADRNIDQKRLSMPLISIQKGTKNQLQDKSLYNNTHNRHSLGISQNHIQTKMRLCQNTNNGKILAVGIVDLSRCNQSIVQRDIQFFESIKPLIEGAQFMFFIKHGGGQAKHIYLDFSLLRLFITSTSNSINADRREILMVENITKTELPQSTLELINTEKSTFNDSQNTYNQGSQSSSTGVSIKRFEFHLILNQNGIAERIQLVTKNYEDLRLWIIGLNALFQNKSNLMRLSTMIKS